MCNFREKPIEEKPKPPQPQPKPAMNLVPQPGGSSPTTNSQIRKSKSNEVSSCDECGKTFSRPSVLMVHMQMLHGKTIKKPAIATSEKPGTFNLLTMRLNPLYVQLITDRPAFSQLSTLKVNSPFLKAKSNELGTPVNEPDHGTLLNFKMPKKTYNPPALTSAYKVKSPFLKAKAIEPGAQVIETDPETSHNVLMPKKIIRERWSDDEEEEDVIDIYKQHPNLITKVI